VYVETGNASEAYRQAYDTAARSTKSLNMVASRQLDHSGIALRINELKARQLKRHDVTIERVVNEYRKLAFLDTRKAFDSEGNLKPIHELDDDTAAAIAGLEVEEITAGTIAIGRLKKIKLSDKVRALDSLAKYLKMFADVSITIDGSLVDKLTAARKRAHGSE